MSNSVDSLLAIVTRLVGEAHPSQIRLLASCVSHAESKSSVRACVNSLLATPLRHLFKDLLVAWEEANTSTEQLAGMLLGASHAHVSARMEQSLELVWTGPSSELVATRKTEQALLEVISSAQRELFLVSFVVYKADAVVDALREASSRGVSVSLLLEPGKHQGGKISVDSIGMIRDAVPDARVFTWERKEGSFVGGKVHAKLAVADNSICFISSANLTGHAMEKNMEAGVLIRHGDLPERLSRHMNALETIGVIQQVSSSRENSK